MCLRLVGGSRGTSQGAWGSGDEVEVEGEDELDAGTDSGSKVLLAFDGGKKRIGRVATSTATPSAAPTSQGTLLATANS